MATVERKLNLDHDITVASVFIVDPAYLLLPSILKEYTSFTTNEEVIFNKKWDQFVTKSVFERLKDRWRILNKPIDIHIQSFMHVVYYVSSVNLMRKPPLARR